MTPETKLYEDVEAAFNDGIRFLSVHEDSDRLGVYALEMRTALELMPTLIVDGHFVDDVVKGNVRQALENFVGYLGLLPFLRARSTVLIARIDALPAGPSA